MVDIIEDIIVFKVVWGYKMIIDTFHLKSKDSFTWHHKDTSDGYLIADTKEHGRILFIHTDYDGNMYYSEQELKTLYYDNNCDCMTSCYPMMHYEVRFKIAIELNVLYKDCNTPIDTNFGLYSYVVSVSSPDYSDLFWCLFVY